MRAVALLTVLVSSLLLVRAQQNSGSLSKLTYTRWINLLRYTYETHQREPPVPHQEHFNRTEHVDLIATSIVRHFFNDIFKLVPTDHGFDGVTVRFPVDFLIVLDSSASIGSSNFDKAIQMLTTWVNILDEEEFASGNLRVSMISFSEPDKVIREFRFGSSLNKTAVIDHINSTEYHAGKSTSTAQALWMADAIFSKYSRPSVTRVMLLATDGWSHNELQLPFGVLWPAARLTRLHDVQVFAVGIGDQINHNELEAIVSDPANEHLFELQDYDMMLEVLASVQQKLDRSD